MRFDDHDSLTGHLSAYRPVDHGQGADDSERQAAVAALLRRSSATSLDVLLMTRATRAEDAWSGHVSLPGGKSEPEDDDAWHTAIRETHEELGIQLDPEYATRLCQLERVAARASGRIVPMTITPFVFLETRAQPVVLGDEAADAFWFPLSEAARGALDHEYIYVNGTVRRKLPAWQHDDRVVWGLTHRILTSLIDALCTPPRL